MEKGGGEGAAEENSDVVSGPETVESASRYPYLGAHICDRTRRHGQGRGTPRASESRAVITMLCMALRPGFGAAVKRRAHALKATREYGDAHN